MGRKSLLFIFILFGAPALIYLFWPSDEARIRRLVRDSAAAVEKEDLEALMRNVSFGYSDGRGLSYLFLKDALRREFACYEDIDVEYEGVEITVGEKGATAWLSVRVLATAGGQRGYVLGDLREPARMGLALEKSPSGRWLVTEARVDAPF